MLIARLDDTDHEVSMQVNASDSPGTEDNRWLPSTFVYYGIGLDRGALLAGPRGDQVAGRFTLIPTGPFTPGREWSSLVAAVEGSDPCGSTVTRAAPSSRSRTTCTAAPAA